MTPVNAESDAGALVEASERGEGLDEAFWMVPQRNVYTVEEYAPLNIPVEHLYVDGKMQVYPEIVASKYLNAFLQGSGVVFTATNFVGHIPLNDRVAIDVVPRVPVGNLTRILRIADETPFALESFVRAYTMDLDPLPSVFDELVAAFIRALAEVARGGLYTTYKQRHEDTSFPRGRILVGETLKRHYGRGNISRTTVSWHERTVDNPINRLLKYTIWLVDRRYQSGPNRKGIARLRTALTRFYRLFRSVHLDRTRNFLNAPLVRDPRSIPFSRSYCLQAIYLGLLLVRDQGVDLGHPTGPIRIPSLLINLEAAFESYLRNVLRSQFRNVHPVLKVMDGNNSGPGGAKKPLFDQPGPHLATPDIVVYPFEDALGVRPIVIEVKYKKVVGTPDRTDLNQVITYAATYRAETVVVAHPREREQPSGIRLVGTIGPITVYQYAFDLAASLDNQESAFSHEVRRLVQVEVSKVHLRIRT